MSEIRIGVIGVGHLGKIHSRIASQLENAKLVAVVDPDLNARTALAAEHNIQHASDYSEICADIDAAIIATPTASHFEIAKGLLQHGIHVLVEKPMTNTSSQARHLVALADKQKLTLQVGHTERFNPVFEMAADEIVNPLLIQSQRTSNYTFRSTDIGVVHDLMIHDIDLALSLNRCDVTGVSATGMSLFSDLEDVAQARIEFSNGCVANLTASRTSFVPTRTMEVVSENGFWNLDFATGTLKAARLSEEVLTGTHGFASMNHEQQAKAREEIFTRYLPLSEVTPEKQNAILNEQRDFISCIGSSQQPRVSAHEGCLAVQVCDLILQQITSRNELLAPPATIPLPIRKAA